MEKVEYKQNELEQKIDDDGFHIQIKNNEIKEFWKQNFKSFIQLK